MNSYEKYHYQVFECAPNYPASMHKISYYIAWLYQQGKSANTIVTYLSGLSYHHKSNAMQDPVQFFTIQKMLKGVQNLSNRPDLRLPITPAILNRLVLCLKHVTPNKYNSSNRDFLQLCLI